MEYVRREIAAGNLRLNCPSCGKTDWQQSGMGQGLLHCDRCFTHTSLVEWVSYIKRVGDDDRHVVLIISREESGASGFFVHVDTSTRMSGDTKNIESVRFCTPHKGERSFSLVNALRDLAGFSENNDPTVCSFEGGGGMLKVYRSIEGGYTWMKTTNLDNNVFHGANVFFPNGHVLSLHIPRLIEAMLHDMENHPL